MWTLLIRSREARELCQFYLKMIALVIFIFHSIIAQGKCNVSENGKGSYCRSDDECDKTRFLLCNGLGGTCDCNKAIGAAWIAEEDSCMISENAPCERSWDEPKCVTNSSCSDRRCACDYGFLRSGFERCELSYGIKCSESEPCAKRYLLECVKNDKGTQSTCKCRNQGVEYVWDDDKQKCVSTAGGACDLPEENQNDDRLECIQNAECVHSGSMGICQCKSGFNHTPEGTCLLQLGGKCDSNNKCDDHQFLLCRDGKCACQFYSQMKYDTKSKQCRWLAGEVGCNVGSANEENSGKRYPMCVADSICKQRSHGSQIGVCSCLDGMMRLPDGSCSRRLVGHGLPCSITMNDCDDSIFLGCIMKNDGLWMCECPQVDMFFDGKECRVRAGRNCTLNKSCADNSHCEGTWCVCNDGYEIPLVQGTHTGCIRTGKFHARNPPNSEGLLQGQPNWSATYSEMTNCDDIPQESIKWARCHCQIQYGLDSHIWILEKNSCLALVGIKCQHDSDCVPNAICDVHEKICQCSATAHTTKDGMCMMAKHPLDPEFRECTEIHTLKSVRSQEDLHSNEAEAVNTPTTGFAFLIAAIIVVGIQN